MNAPTTVQRGMMKIGGHKVTHIQMEGNTEKLKESTRTQSKDPAPTDKDDEPAKTKRPKAPHTEPSNRKDKSSTN